MYMDQALSVLEALFGETPIGWYTGRDSPNTRQLLAEFPQIQYDCDYYGDDLPFWTTLTQPDGSTRPHLIIPYTLESNDMKFCSPGGFNSGEQFFSISKMPLMCSMLKVKLHQNALYRHALPHFRSPWTLQGTTTLLDYVQSHDRVWICRRNDIAKHWYTQHPYQAP